MAFAAPAATENRARLVVEALAMLARHHASVEPLVQVSGVRVAIVPRTKTRAVLVPAPLASVPWTERAATLRRTA